MGSEQSKKAQSASATTYSHIYKLSKNCTSVDDYTIKDTDSGNVFKVKQAGIRFTLLATQKNSSMAHFGLLLNNNTFFTPDGKSFSYVLVHRVEKEIKVVFANFWNSPPSGQDVMRDDFRRALNAPTDAIVSQVMIGSVVRRASTYCEIIRKEMSLDFRIKLKNPSKQTNCIAFCARVTKMLDLSVGSLASLMRKHMVVEDWNEDFADLTCVMLDILLGNKTVDAKGKQYAVGVMNSLISDDAVNAMTAAFARYNINH